MGEIVSILKYIFSSVWIYGGITLWILILSSVRLNAFYSKKNHRE